MRPDAFFANDLASELAKQLPKTTIINSTKLPGAFFTTEVKLCHAEAFWAITYALDILKKHRCFRRCLRVYIA